MRKPIAFAATTAALALASPSQATLLHFVLTSPDPSFPNEFADFYLDSHPTPDAALSGTGFIIAGVPGTFLYEGYDQTSIDDLIFYHEDFGGGFMTYDYIISTVGPQLYTGDEETGPTFLTGTFDLLDFLTGQPLSLTISEVPEAAVPEPASWMMMIAGFCLAGAGLRRRVKSVGYAVSQT